MIIGLCPHMKYHAFYAWMFIQNCELISLYYINFLNDYVNIVDLDAATKIKANYKIAIDSFYIGTPGGIRTPDLLVRSQTLYPAELPAQIVIKSCHIILPLQKRKIKH